jgi:hypothetical protein
VRIDRDDAAEDSDGHPDGPDVPGQCEGEQAGPDEGDDRSGPADEADEADESDEAVQAERAVAYPDAVRAVYRAYAIDQGCAEVEKIEKDTVTPAMLRIEAEDPDRSLVGLENRLKGRARLAEKVENWMTAQPDLQPDEAFRLAKDAIRYTFVYEEVKYTAGVYADCDRLGSEGFEPVDRQNSWADDQYKGINGRWREQGSGQLFEVQFHTQDSFDAKQVTHASYERIRDPSTPPDEVRRLRAHQREVCATIPIPRGATEILNYNSCRRI